ncbi:MAG: tetratricopeptide repeat protein [Pseudomonadota bacterium]
MMKAEVPPSFPLLRLIARLRAFFGHTPSMVLLGMVYESGGVAGRDISDANREYLRAAERGDTQAMWLLGVNHLSSKTGATDEDTALHWLHEAALNGHGMAGWALGRLYLKGKLVETDHAQGLKLLEASARAGCEPARDFLIKIFRDGYEGIAPDRERAQAWEQDAGIAG